MIRIAIAEDHQSLIDGIKLLLEYNETISIVGTANDGEALLKIVRLKQPDIVITDIRMPKIDGITVTKIIKKEFPNIKVIAFTMFDQLEAVEKMIEVGVSGYILKNAPLKTIISAIHTVTQGKAYFDTQLNTNALGLNKQHKTKNKLTKRQIEILELVAEGKTSREIAEQLFIGTYTVDTHRKNIIKILGLQGKGELMRFALQRKYTF